MEEVSQTFSLIENKKFDVLELSTILLILASLFSIINLRILKLPMTIGLMILAIALSISLLLIGYFFPSMLNLAYTITESFDSVIIKLSFLKYILAIGSSFIILILILFY